MQIVEIESDEGFAEAFPVVWELHGDLDERRYRELLPGMRATGYRMFAVREQGVIVAVARSRGHGERLLRHVEGVARDEGCGYVALACGRERDGALRFYEQRMGYERPGYSMRKAL